MRTDCTIVPGITAMRCTGWHTVVDAQDADRVVTQLEPFHPSDYITVPAGYELHIIVQAKPSAKLKRERRKVGRASRTVKVKP